MTRSSKVAAAAIAAVVALLLYPRPAPGFPATGEVLATPIAVGGGSPTASPVPEASDVLVPSPMRAAPHPTSQIGQPASYCRQFCDSPEPRVVVSKGSGTTGLASWYDDGPGLYVALPGGDFRGHNAVICGLDPYNCLTVPVRTSCICTGPPPKVADLSPDLFRQFAPLSRGIVKVTVTILGGKP